MGCTSAVCGKVSFGLCGRSRGIATFKGSPAAAPAAPAVSVASSRGRRLSGARGSERVSRSNSNSRSGSSVGIVARAASMDAEANSHNVTAIPTVPIEGQKTGTSGLRKKAKVFSSGNYLANWVQSLFTALGSEVRGKDIVLGGDGRWFNKEAAQIIIRVAAGNGVRKVYVGQDAIMATPAASAVIRGRNLYGGLIMSASHNPGGPDEDWGIKFNYQSGEPAPERITDKIFEETKQIKEIYERLDIANVDLSKIGETSFEGGFSVEVISPTEDYVALLKNVFNFDMIRAFMSRSDFEFCFDGLHAVTGAYAGPIFVDELGAPSDSLRNCVPKEDFGGGHPDPNLTYAKDLVAAMMRDSGSTPDFGAASDGDGDRNMILGSRFFVTPSDSVAMIAANAEECIPYFQGGVKGLARSMPTSQALDRVAEKMGVPFFETPTGWKFFGNLMDADKCSVCGEESFGTGSDHVREKDGIWAVLSWLSILSKKNEGVPIGGKMVTVGDVAREHWKEFGRNFFMRYDYENCDSESANKMMDHVRGIIANTKPNSKIGDFTVSVADDFSYTDPIDGSVATKQGLRFIFTDGSRIIFRLSGTGSSGATIRLYIEQYEKDPSKVDVDAKEALKSIIETALEVSKLKEFTGRDKPTVIT